NGLAVGGDNNLYAFGGHYNGLGTGIPGDVDFGDGFKLTDETNKMGDLYLAGYNPSNGTTQEVHLVAKGTASESAYSLTGFNDKLYLAAVVRSAPVTFENNTDTYSTNSTNSGSFDFALVKYTVQTTPIAVCNQKDQAAFAYFNKADRSVIINHAENIVSAKVFGLDGRLVQSAVNQGEASDIRIYGINPGIYVIRTATVSGEAGLFKLIVF
ncbi:MAG: T9SS type A sorting domain-containing protein, partial [Bacteroidales bacterium]